MAKWTFIALSLFVFASVEQAGAQVATPVLSEGQWAKFSVKNDGVYQIDYNLLRAAGFAVNNLDPRRLSVYAAENGMLPQPNSEPRLNQLTELAIRVSGESDGVLNPGDYILFFAKGPDKYHYDINKDCFYYENNIYTDENFYFVTVSGNDGKRMASVPSLADPAPIVNVGNDFVFHEEEKYNELHSGRDWFGEQFDLTTELALKFEVPGFIEGPASKVVSSVMAQSFGGSSFKLNLNGSLILEQPVAAIPNTQYGIKGRVRNDTVNFAGGSAQLEFKYQYVKSPSGKSIGYLNYFLVSFERTLALYGNQTIFQAARSLSNTHSKFDLIANEGNLLIWDISDPWNCAIQEYQSDGNQISFTTSTTNLKQFIIADQAFPTPVFKEAVANQNVSQASAELLIITAPTFEAEAQRLANHRSTKQGLAVAVVTTEKVYNEYAGGKQDPTAIRDFVKDVTGKFGQTQNVLLFGRCSYDYKNRVINNTNFVPTYESRNSLSPLETYSSDDYFAFLDDNEGGWSESPTQTHVMDIGVGRLPVSTIEEAKIIVDKLISYDNNPKAFGPWRQRIAFVADDGDFNLHQSDADKLAVDIDNNQPQLTPKRIYLDAFPQISKPSGQESPSARQALKETTRQGAVIINFTGHGSEKVWLQERILDDDFVKDWKNPNEFPLLVTATCEFGRHDDPSITSNSIVSIVKEEGGSIGLVTASRPVSAFTNSALNKAFYQALFTRIDGRYRDLGAIFRETKNNSLNGVSNRNFSLLADPSMQLAIPNRDIEITEIETLSGSDTIKALSTVTIKGLIKDNNGPDMNFNGIATITINDKPSSLSTLGDENAVFNYQERTNTLFRGQATVTNGTFAVDFIVPKNIAYQFGSGKASAYAFDVIRGVDACGGDADFIVGGSEPAPAVDSTPPTIRLFMGDTTFRHGSQVNSSTQLVALLQDDSGINMTDYGIGNALTAILDGEQEFALSDYYVADKDDYSKGTLVFPIDDLKPGKHTITVNAWDVHNNPASATIEFVATREDALLLETLRSYPNPFSESTVIEFTHSRPGDDLEAQMEIFDRNGRPVYRAVYHLPESTSTVTLAEWKGTNGEGAKLGNGIYLIRLVVRSLVDGSKNGHVAKVIILN